VDFFCFCVRIGALFLMTMLLFAGVVDFIIPCGFRKRN